MSWSAAASLLLDWLVGLGLQVNLLFVRYAAHLNPRVLRYLKVTSFFMSITPFSIFSSKF